ncbi:MAG: aminotransferase class V-fold PLP-dependent enzyme, partial [Saprospiraceae bacterium]|nr:aminotransferase class V-fold PLP-dependent enzyme [Saprospiraceae bacterium]
MKNLHAIAPEVDLSCQKHLFNLPDSISYLNCAYMGPLMHEIEQAGIRGLTRKSLPFEITAKDFFEPLEQLKSLFSQLIGNDDPQRIAFQPSVSYGIATVVKNMPLKKGGNIIMLKDQFPSNVLAFQELAKREDLHLRFIEPPTSFQNRSERWNEKLLDAIDQDTICVACPHTHWADGTIFNLADIRQATWQNDALVIVDGTQSIGALPFSINDLNPDALVCAGYKFLLGPYSCALSYFGSMFDNGQPLEYNWIARKDSDQFGGLVEYQPEYRPKAYRYNVGECSNFIMVPMLIKAIEQLLEWGIEPSQRYCSQLISSSLDQILEM